MKFEDRVQKPWVAIIRKAPHLCRRSEAQFVLWSGGTVNQDVQIRIGRKTDDTRRPRSTDVARFFLGMTALPRTKPECQKSTTADTVPISVFS